MQRKLTEGFLKGMSVRDYLLFLSITELNSLESILPDDYNEMLDFKFWKKKMK